MKMISILEEFTVIKYMGLRDMVVFEMKSTKI